jgi:hypothetical protein
MRGVLLMIVRRSLPGGNSTSQTANRSMSRPGKAGIDPVFWQLSAVQYIVYTYNTLIVDEANRLQHISNDGALLIHS